MTLWRYTAIPLAGGTRRTGELAGETPAEVRAALRRIGLQPLDVKRVRDRRDGTAARPWTALVDRHLRARRGPIKGELYDSLATMLEAGVPLLEALDTIAGSSGRRARSVRVLLASMRDALRSGEHLAAAMRPHPSWFDPAEIAMVEAGQHAGELPSVLASLTDRHERSSELGARLVSALAYPAVVVLVGIGVVIFLSTKTLPDLSAILLGAGIEIPRLTRAVMWLGQGALSHGPIAVLLGALGACAAAVVWRRVAAHALGAPAWVRRLTPQVVRRAAVASTLLNLAELLRAGVPLVEALRIVAPTAGGPMTGGLRRLLADAAERLERGDPLSDALDDRFWFDDELRRLLVVGESGGELDDVLERVGQRDRRRARRLIDRLAALLEPGAILLLAVVVGIVVMAAVLPLVRMQEMI